MEGKKSSGSSMNTPLSGNEQIQKISSSSGEGPINTPLDTGHVAGKGASEKGK